MLYSAFIVRVPDAEPLVNELRLRFDGTAKLGVPAHITILVPFMEPTNITQDVIHRAQKAFQDISPFKFQLNAVCRWPETTYLSPTPPRPFVELTTAIIKEFPDFPPYAGKHSEIIPHLTVADGNYESAATAQAELLSAFKITGPIEAKCGEIELLENSSGFWKTLHVLSLTPSDG